MSIMVIWYLSATIMQMCFTSLLLGVYFLRKPSLTAESLEDLVENPNLLIGGYYSFKEIKDLEPDIYDKLEHRVRQYDTYLGYELYQSRPILYLMDHKLVKDIINRKAVFMVDSYFGGVFQRFYPGADLMLSQNKYAQHYSYFFATKNIFINQKDEVKFQQM